MLSALQMNPDAGEEQAQLIALRQGLLQATVKSAVEHNALGGLDMGRYKELYYFDHGWYMLVCNLERCN